MKFICGQFHLVNVKWSHTPEKVAPLVEAMTGQVAGEACDHEYTHAVPNDRFSRDDIDSEQVQRGYRSHVIAPVARWYFPVDKAPLYHWKGLLRMKTEGGGVDPYFVGYAKDLESAVTWIAHGAETVLMRPWEAMKQEGAW